MWQAPKRIDVDEVDDRDSCEPKPSHVPSSPNSPGLMGAIAEALEPNRGSDLWHNGGTYGGASFLAIDRAAGKAVATFANTGPRLVPQLDGRSWKLFDNLG